METNSKRFQWAQTTRASEAQPGKTSTSTKPGVSKTGQMNEVRPFSKKDSFIAGHTAENLDRWEVYTSDPWVLDQIKGMSIPFTSFPNQKFIPRIFSLNSSEREKLRVELDKMCYL